MWGATHRGLASASMLPGFPLAPGTELPVEDASPGGGGGGGTVGLTTDFRWLAPES